MQRLGSRADRYARVGALAQQRGERLTRGVVLLNQQHAAVCAPFGRIVYGQRSRALVVRACGAMPTTAKSLPEHSLACSPLARHNPRSHDYTIPKIHTQTRGGRHHDVVPTLSGRSLERKFRAVAPHGETNAALRAVRNAVAHNLVKRAPGCPPRQSQAMWSCATAVRSPPPPSPAPPRAAPRRAAPPVSRPPQPPRAAGRPQQVPPRGSAPHSIHPRRRATNCVPTPNFIPSLRIPTSD